MGVFAVILVLFDIGINPQFSMPRETEQADAEQEAQFHECVERKDRAVHAETFGNVDNPDVQREMLMTRKERVVSECRDEFPEIRMSIMEPFRFNVIDIKFRY